MLSLPSRVLSLVESPVLLVKRGRRFLARRPVRVHLKGHKDISETVKEYEEIVKTHTNEGKQKGRIREETPKPEPPPDPDAMLRKHINYKLLSDAGTYERKLLENMKNAKYRREHQLFAVEGYRVIREALQHKVTPAALYFTRLKLVATLKAAPSKLELKDILALNDLPLFKAPYKTLQTWSSVSTSPGILGVFKIPSDIQPPSPLPTSSPTLPLTLVLDELREPGNLGGVLRTAAAVGVSEVMLMKGCCDPWEAKVVRAASGAHFRLKLSTKVTWDVLSGRIPENSEIFLADVHREEDGLDDDGEEDEASLMEDEREGSKRDKEVSRKGRGRRYDNREVKGVSVKEERRNYDADDNTYEIDEEGNKLKNEDGYNDPEHLKFYQHASLPTLRYDRLGLKWAKGGAVLVIGGEVGITNAAKKFAVDNYGRKVTIPLANGMDSLNVGVASGVIMYEMQKQLNEFAAKMEWKERQEGEG